MKRRLAYVLLAVVTVGLALTACQTGTSLVSSLTVNGITAIDTTAGTADMGVSALDSSGKVIGTGTITVPTASITSATDGSGSPVSGYKATAQVCGNIVTQTGDLRAMLTLDATGSMYSSDPNQLRADAAKQFVQDMIDNSPGGLAAVSSFDTSTAPSGSYLAIKVYQDLTADQTLLNTAIDSATFDGGTTNLWDAGFDSVQYFSDQNVTSANKVAVLLTDGSDNSSTKTPADVISAATAEGVRVYTIGLGNYVDSQDLIDVAAGTQGTYSQVADASDLTNLFQNVFNATQGSGCIQIQFSQVPTTGHTLSGTISAKIDGHSVSGTYQVTWP